MNRYFFDVVGHGRSELDYTDRLLPSPERAYDAAELMAFDLVVKWEERSAGPSMYPIVRGENFSRSR
jgi:hypothetical protein